MSDDSKFVLRWETSTLARGRTESGVFNEAGFKWVVSLEGDKFSLQCGVDHGGPWMCEGKLSCYAYRADGQLTELQFTGIAGMQKNFSLNERIRLFEKKNCRFYNRYDFERFINDKITFEFRVNIISSDRGEPNDEPFMFDVPCATSNVILKIDEKKLHVSKELLSISSPVFEAMFFGGFAEKGKDEVEIKDVIYEEFVDFLNVLYPRQQGRYWITDSSIVHVLALGDRFQVEHAMVLAETHLRTVSMFKMTEKLLLADQYRRVKLRDHCLQTLSSSHVFQLKSTPEYAYFFSADTKTAIDDRMKQLTTVV